MAETVVSTILEQLTTIAIENAREEWALVTGVEEEVERLASNFKAIQLELEDAEQKQFTNERVKHWLDRFKLVSFDMEDVLDDWKTALDQLQTDGDETSCVPKWMVCLFLSCFSFCTRVARHHDIATRIKKINEKLDEIAKDKVRSELVKSEIQGPKRLESTSFVVDVSRIVGRDVVKEEIISRLLSGSGEEGSSNHVPTISVVGMGGMGKTALAQLIFNDHRIQTHFEHKIWVCVSDSFDQRQIARTILGGLDPNSPNLQHGVSLERLLSEIRAKIKGMKFLFVLDDVWTDRDEDWEPLKATFQHGKMGSWILATTRKESVAGQMGLSNVFHLQQLSEEMCWLIIAQLAFVGGNDKRRKHLEDIGRKIASKCKGLPLAAKTLGSLLRDKLRSEEWENVLNSEIWKIKFEQDIFLSLVLSYNDLPSTIRRCLLYCAIFPKDYQIDKDELILHWMAQGYLNSDDDFGREVQGEDYFKCLAARSFFQDFEKDDNGNICYCRMHDMVHDFIQFLTKYEVVTEEVKVKDLRLDLSPRKARHLRLAMARESAFPLSVKGNEKLRSLVAVTPGFCDISNEMLQNLFAQSKRLRLLELDSLLPVKKEICREIGSLIHLRYLRLAFCNDIESLPEAVGELCNLQSLIIYRCRDLKKLPVGIGNLINLKYLVIKDCDDLTFYPKAIGKLTSLRRLSHIRMRADGNDVQRFSIGDLQYLDLLAGDVEIELVGKTIDGDEAKRAQLRNKIHLKKIRIDLLSPSIKKEDVVQALNPPSTSSVVVRTFWHCVRVQHYKQQAALAFIGAAGSSEPTS